MELGWFLFGICSYSAYAISTTIDKHMMNKKFDILSTTFFKCFFDGMILALLAVLFFTFELSISLLIWSLILGFTFVLGVILYYRILSQYEVTSFVPLLQSLEVLVIFLFAVFIFQENTQVVHYLGAFLTAGGVLAVAYKKSKWKIDKKVVVFLIGLLALSVITALLTKYALATVDPVPLGIMVYFVASFLLGIYWIIFQRKNTHSSLPDSHSLKTIFLSSIFGAIGTFFLFYALYRGDASKVYSLSGLQSVFLIALGAIFLKEKITIRKILGIVLIGAGIFLIGQ